MSIKLTVPEKTVMHLKPRISVIGVGGGGGNAVNNMISQNLEGVDFIVANTDSQALANSKAGRKIQLGLETTRGLGAGANPDIGKISAEEAIEEIERELDGVNMVFITAGMGGGTGSGAAPVIARMAREKGILTVGVVTKPFQFEGRKRSEIADRSIEEFAGNVDSIIIIPNQNLFRIADKNTTLADAFVMADNVLYAGIRSITDLMIMPGLINLDFADVKCIMEGKGKAIMGTGEAEGEDRAVKAAEQALSNPLLDDCSVIGAQGVLINITGGSDITLFEIDEAANRIKEEIAEDANIIFGSSYDETLDGKIRVSIVATGIAAATREIKKPVVIEQKAVIANEINIPKETLSANLEKFSATKIEVEEDFEEEDIIPDVIKEFENIENSIIEHELESISENNVLEEMTQKPIRIEDFETYDDLEKSIIMDEMPKASSLFKAIVNKPEKQSVESQLEIALAASQNTFAPKATIKISEDEPELFPDHNPNAFSGHRHEAQEELIVNNEDEYTPTLIERVTGFSIAKRNKKKKEEEQFQQPISPSFIREDNYSDNKLNLEIPSFLRRK
ncbi:MAG: cell division protein FtsZ [Alphaproteobacteria bacterium]|nr:cell division protein FtsZ [Alphaproteobacteria bacterium]